MGEMLLINPPDAGSKIKHNPKKTKGEFMKHEKNPWSHVPSYVSVHRKLTPVSAYDRFIKNPVMAFRHNLVTPFSMEGVYELIGLSVGIAGTPLVPSLILGSKYKGWVKPVSNVATAILLATGAKMLIKKEGVAKSVLWGGLSVTLIQTMFGLLSKSTNAIAMKVSSGINPMPGLGSEAGVRKQLEEGVLKELNRVGSPRATVPYRTVGQPRAAYPYQPSVGNLMETNL